MRIVEPFIKAHLALWLAERGARKITVSLDGAEPQLELVGQILTQTGYTHSPSVRSAVSWTGSYSLDGRAEITEVSRPGFDIDAEFPDSKRCVAECKGEPTEAGVRAGQDLDLTAFYTGLGQLIIALGATVASPDWKILAVPDTAGLRPPCHDGRKKPPSPGARNLSSPGR